MVRKIVIYGHPVLREKGARVDEVSDEVRQLASDMIETMNEAEGVGLAAQQVGEALQLAVVDVSKSKEPMSYLRVNGEETALEDLMPLVFMNPEVRGTGAKEKAEEGCLSFPDVRGDIVRSGGVRAKVSTLDGEELEIETDGLLARAIQHEVDHLNGILFIDRMSTAKKMSLKRDLRALKQEGEAMV